MGDGSTFGALAVRIDDHPEGRPVTPRGAASSDVCSGPAVAATSAILVNSPHFHALDQVLPFFAEGILDPAAPVFFVERPRLARRCQARGPIRFTYLTRQEMRALPVPDGTVVLYPFNGMTNVNAVSDRRLRHVLVLHGESNKVASMKPAARLYDYVTIAGPLAWRRYREARIFTDEDLAQGRVVAMGDSFVQTSPWLCPGSGNGDDWLLYAPTWEGGLASEDYSSVAGGKGLGMACRCAGALGLRRILVKPHPNLGVRDKSVIVALVRAIRAATAAGFEVRVIGEGLNWRLACALRLLTSSTGDGAVATAHPVRLALVDVSGMEALCLKQRIPHLVLISDSAPDLVRDGELSEIYHCKAIRLSTPGPAAESGVSAYVSHAGEIDGRHRALVFGWHVPELEAMAPAMRRRWLVDYVRGDPFWGG